MIGALSRLQPITSPRQVIVFPLLEIMLRANQSQQRRPGIWFEVDDEIEIEFDYSFVLSHVQR
jgi:hypothetical protein